MPTKRIFDLVVLTTLLLHPAIGLVRVRSRAWSKESDGVLGTIGSAVQVAL